MNRKLAIVSIVAAFSIGGIIGHRIANQKYENEFQIRDENQISGHVSKSVYLLNLLRTNDVNKATGQLEDELDWSLIFLNIAMSNAPESPLNSYFPKSVEKAKHIVKNFLTKVAIVQKTKKYQIFFCILMFRQINEF
jgi:hypothetical protein